MPDIDFEQFIKQLESIMSRYTIPYEFDIDIKYDYEKRKSNVTVLSYKTKEELNFIIENWRNKDD